MANVPATHGYYTSTFDCIFGETKLSVCSKYVWLGTQIHELFQNRTKSEIHLVLQPNFPLLCLTPFTKNLLSVVKAQGSPS